MTQRIKAMAIWVVYAIFVGLNTLLENARQLFHRGSSE